MAESSKMDRQGARTPAQLQEQYNFGTKFAEAFGLITAASLEAAKASQAVKDLDENLTPEEIFDRLTDGGKAQGLYRDENGNIFINASYIAAGIISSVNELTKFNLQNGWIESADPNDHNRKIFVDAGKIWLYIFDKYAMKIDTFGNGGQIKFVNPNTEEDVATINGADDQFVIGAENFYLTTRHTNGSLPRYRVQWKNIAGVPVLAGGADNSGKKVLYTGNASAGSTFTVENTADYDLFAVRLGTSSTTENTVVMAYKVGDTIRGVGGWSGDATQNIKLFFLSATFSGNTWTVVDATSKELAGTSVGSAVKLNVKEVVGVI